MLKLALAPTDKIKVLYHANCADGFTSAWIVKKFFDENYLELVEEGNLSFWPCNYNQPVPCELDKNDTVYMVDFCYTPEVMQEIFNKAMYITVLDHHKSAIERMHEYSNTQEMGVADINFNLVFDTTRSGAGITWDYFFDFENRPMIVNYVEDRDLWKFRYKETRAVNANLFSYEYTFKNWDSINEQIKYYLNTFVVAGEAIERKHFKDINEMLSFHTNQIVIGGYTVPVVSVPYMWSSDACNILAQREIDMNGGDEIRAPFAAAFWFIKKTTGEPAVQFSLRSVGDFDVAKIAEKYDGGGHKNASGFVVDFFLFQEMLKDFYWNISTTKINF